MKNKLLNKGFYTYLQQKGYVIETINYYSYNAYYYQKWLDENNIPLPKANYNDLMNYIAYLQSCEKSNVMINKHLKSIELYYNYLEAPNIATNVRVKKKHTHARLFLTEKELTMLYNNYQSRSTTYYNYSDKLILGLIIYQSLELHDLLLLRKADINLVKGSIYIPSGKHLKNSRMLELQAHQIIPLQKYLTHHRKEVETSDLLFLPQALMKHRLVKQLKLIHQSVKEIAVAQDHSYQSLRQLRQSRLVLWIKQYGLRETQYLSGHKGITSIERYQKQDIEDLSKQILKFHPLG